MGALFNGCILGELYFDTDADCGLAEVHEAFSELREQFLGECVEPLRERLEEHLTGLTGDKAVVRRLIDDCDVQKTEEPQVAGPPSRCLVTGDCRLTHLQSFKVRANPYYMWLNGSEQSEIFPVFVKKLTQRVDTPDAEGLLRQQTIALKAELGETVLAFNRLTHVVQNIRFNLLSFVGAGSFSRPLCPSSLPRRRS